MVVFLLLLGIGNLLIPAVRDYSDVFPQAFDFEVFFDDEGITLALAQLTGEERQELMIKPDWREDKKAYLLDLTKDLEEEYGVEFVFTDTVAVHSRGHTTFKIEKTGGWGLQKYRIATSVGEVDHTYEAAEQPSIVFESRFELIDTRSNYIELSLADVYAGWTVIMQPQFWQLFRHSPTDEYKRHHRIVAVTKVRFFPVRDLGHTIYLRPDGAGHYFPIGYAIYGSRHSLE